MKAKRKKRCKSFKFDADTVMNSNNFELCQRILKGNKDNDVLIEIALYALDPRVRKHALRKVTSERVLLNFCIKVTPEGELYGFAKSKIYASENLNFLTNEEFKFADKCIKKAKEMELLQYVEAIAS